MKSTTSILTICAALAFSGAQAADQTDAKSTSASQQNASLQEANAQEFFRASDLIGKSTQDSKGVKIGEIKEITFNQQGEVFAFLDVGNGKYAVVPWQAFNMATAKGKGNVTVNATDQQLKAGPAVTKDQWGSLDNPKFVQGCYSYYNIQAPTATGGASTPGGKTQGQSSGNSPDTNSTPR